MFELHQVGERSYYIEAPAKIGIYRAGDTGVYLIDSGNDKDAGRKVRRILEENGWQLLGILATHSHADHIGGSRYLQQQTGCRVFACGIEKAFTEYPMLEPAFLYGGYPMKEICHKFLMAQESVVSDFTDDAFPREIEIIPLKGHFFDMVGFRTPDDAVYLADCLSSRETLDKYQIGFIYDVEKYLNTLEMVKTLKASIFIPAHAAPAKDIAELAQYNINKVAEVSNRIAKLCEEPRSFENILQELFAGYGLKMNFEQYVLVGSTVRSYLSWLKDTGRLTAYFDDNMLLWKAAE